MVFDAKGQEGSTEQYHPSVAFQIKSGHKMQIAQISKGPGDGFPKERKIGKRIPGKREES